MGNLRSRLTALVLGFCSLGGAVELRALPEFFRPDPFGGIVKSDREGAAFGEVLRLKGGRDGYVSGHVVAVLDAPAEYQISIDFPLPSDTYREWFHRNASDRQFYPDALIPLRMPYRSQMPEADNRISGQKAQAFWIDVWIPAETKAGLYRGEVRLASGSRQTSIPLELTVLPEAVPQQDAVTLDSNSYGTSWMFDQYPKTLSRTNDNDLFRLIHAYHRIFYEHRTTFHQLGYGHGGKVGPEFAPELAGSGRAKHIVSWDSFDRHYGPLLDGSAFQQTRRGSKPIPYVYLPVNPEWPASYLWWGQPGYEAEFTRVLSEMEQHFREKKWTGTVFEVFFNHKKRYKGFPWDGDEVRFSRDNEYLIAYHRLLQKAIPADTPVHFVMRADVSWTMAEQFEKLRGIVKFWIAGEGMLSWYPDAVRQLNERGDTVWTYGGTPAVQQGSSDIALNPLRSWISKVGGFVRWQTVAPGPDPWFNLSGGGETLVYPGDRFGLGEPLASIRLKLQRNCLQDLALLESRAKAGSRETVQAEVVRRFNGSSLADWRNSAPPLASKPALEWDNLNIGEALRPFESRFDRVQPDAWLRVRDYALSGGIQ